MNINNYHPAQEPFITELSTFSDSRGMLQTLDTSQLPFLVERVFTIVPDTPGTVRGGHAHKACWQAIFVIGKNIQVRGKNTKNAFSYSLQPGLLLVIPPWNWIQVLFEEGSSAAVVLCSQRYLAEDYIIEAP